jgi:hypothetical protein
VRDGVNVRDRVREGHVNFDRFCDKVLDLTQHPEIVLGLDVVRIRRIQARDKASKRRDADALPYAEDSCKRKLL